MKHPWQDDTFIAGAAAQLSSACTRTGERAYLLPGPDWHCTLEQSPGDFGPESTIHWVCPTLAITEAHIRQVLATMAKPPVPQLSVRYGKPKGWFRKSDPELMIDDDAGILDDVLHTRLNQWPDAYTVDGKCTPARLGYILVEQTGLWVRSSGWWASTPALVHQIHLGIDLAARLRPHFR